MSNALNFLRRTAFGYDIFVNGWHLAKAVENPAGPKYDIIDRQGERVGPSIPLNPDILGAWVTYLVKNGHLHICDWLVAVRSGDPEPSCEADLWREVECGAPVSFNKHGSWHCEAGHEHVSYADPARGAYEMELAMIERMEDR